MKIRSSSNLRLVLTSLLAAFALCSTASANDNFDLDPYSSDRIVNLRGKWKFSIGDDKRWSTPDYNDKEWSRVSAPDKWEDEGYRDYDGYAWYRKTFTFPNSRKNSSAFIYLGKIDDVDQVFINGKLIGSTGQFPPNYNSAYDQKRAYMIPRDVLNAGGENLVAVRVYDGGWGGGIKSGRLGIYESEMPALKIDLSGEWRFSTGDNPDWAEKDFDESNFDTIQAPGAWDKQGYAHYDGFAWYRKTFSRADLADAESLILLLGKIDDYDEVYLNGKKIAGTGEMNPPQPNSYSNDRYYDQNRAYHFSAALLEDENTIAVRVYDKIEAGGIYAGPLGIITQNDYIAYWENRRKNQSFIKDIRRAFD